MAFDVNCSIFFICFAAASLSFDANAVGRYVTVEAEDGSEWMDNTPPNTPLRNWFLVSMMPHILNLKAPWIPMSLVLPDKEKKAAFLDMLTAAPCTGAAKESLNRCGFLAIRGAKYSAEEGFSSDVISVFIDCHRQQFSLNKVALQVTTDPKGNQGAVSLQYLDQIGATPHTFDDAPPEMGRYIKGACKQFATDSWHLANFKGDGPYKGITYKLSDALMQPKLPSAPNRTGVRANAIQF